MMHPLHFYRWDICTFDRRESNLTPCSPSTILLLVCCPYSTNRKHLVFVLQYQSQPPKTGYPLTIVPCFSELSSIKPSNSHGFYCIYALHSQAIYAQITDSNYDKFSHVYSLLLFSSHNEHIISGGRPSDIQHETIVCFPNLVASCPTSKLLVQIK